MPILIIEAIESNRGIMIVIFAPTEDMTFPYQCFFPNGKCLLVSKDFTKKQVIESQIYPEEIPFIISHIPHQVVRIAAKFNLLQIH